MKRTIFWDVTSKKVIVFFNMHSVFCEVGIEFINVT